MESGIIRRIFGSLPRVREDQMRVWVTRLYFGVAVVLVPWVFYLAVSLPARNLSAHYRGAWVGFDVALVVVLARVGWLAHRRSPRIVLSAAAGSAMLLTDAWFDVATSTTGSARTQALLAAVLLEIPAAILSALLARRALQRLADLAAVSVFPLPPSSPSSR